MAKPGLWWHQGQERQDTRLIFQLSLWLPFSCSPLFSDWASSVLSRSLGTWHFPPLSPGRIELLIFVSKFKHHRERGDWLRLGQVRIPEPINSCQGDGFCYKPRGASSLSLDQWPRSQEAQEVLRVQPKHTVKEGGEHMTQKKEVLSGANKIVGTYCFQLVPEHYLDPSFNPLHTKLFLWKNIVQWYFFFLNNLSNGKNWEKTILYIVSKLRNIN